MTTPTTTIPAPALRGGAPESSACDVCPHPSAGHDRIAERFCRATLHAALTRGCICVST